MIAINRMNAPLELDVSLNELFSAFRQHQSYIRNQNISYSYLDILSIKEAIGIHLELDTLVHYPLLCKTLRALNQLDYQVELSLHDIPSMNQNGLDAIIQALAAIKNKLIDARVKKAKLDAQFNNLVYLYGQNATVPTLRDFKPYYTMRKSSYNLHSTRSRKVNISGINYFMLYYGKRFRKMKSLYQLSEYHLLSNYFNATEKDETSIKKIMKTYLIGGFINTPVFAFRSKYDYKHAGKKYYIDLSTNKTYTRLNDAKNIASKYYINPPLTLLETLK